MDSTADSFDWALARAFLATAEEGSLSAAARKLGLTQPTLGRQVAALERALAVTLFDRAGRGLVLTDAGHDLLPHARAMRDAANRVSLSASRQARDIAGPVRITASEILATHALPGLVAQLRADAPGLDIDLVADDSLRDLHRREADIAIRHVRPTEPDLIARLISNATARAYAATSYVARHGRPRLIADAPAHEFVGFAANDQMLEFLHGLGLMITADNIRSRSSSGNAALALIRAGLGISLLPDHPCRGFDDLVPVFDDLAPVRFPVWLITHRELHTSRRIRFVFDRLAAHLDSTMADVPLAPGGG
ncbi:MAG: LysR family transcriptional regulator [Marinibacterium sp.]|nr:LysR family transcriptional regulator [Marinibacterium sp.]